MKNAQNLFWGPRFWCSFHFPGSEFNQEGHLRLAQFSYGNLQIMVSIFVVLPKLSKAFHKYIQTWSGILCEINQILSWFSHKNPIRINMWTKSRLEILRLILHHLFTIWILSLIAISISLCTLSKCIANLVHNSIFHTSFLFPPEFWSPHVLFWPTVPIWGYESV